MARNSTCARIAFESPQLLEILLTEIGVASRSEKVISGLLSGSRSIRQSQSPERSGTWKFPMHRMHEYHAVDVV